MRPDHQVGTRLTLEFLHFRKTGMHFTLHISGIAPKLTCAQDKLFPAIGWVGEILFILATLDKRSGAAYQ